MFNSTDVIGHRPSACDDYEQIADRLKCLLKQTSGLAAGYERRGRDE